MRKDTCSPGEFVTFIRETIEVESSSPEGSSTPTAGTTSVREVHQNVCFNCHASCLTCNGPEHTRCLSCDADKNLELFKGRCVCKSGFYYSQTSDSCIACEDQGCGICSWPDRNKCVSCPEPS
jgi:hypothetical protein